MAPEQVRAASGWLRLREPADADARSTELVDIVREHLPDGPLEIHDLGGGTGSMTRWLAPRLDGRQRWVVHDRDAELLEQARGIPAPRSRDGAEVTLETCLDDITRLDPSMLAGASLITASALLDMFTAEELDRFVRMCAGARCPVLVTLSVVGRVELTPDEPLDEPVAAAFNAHQQRSFLSGRLLGPGAAAAAARAFEGSGFDVLERPSHWRLTPDQSALADEWFTGWIGAALEQDPRLADRTGPYVDQRRTQLAAQGLSVTVEHVDLLALPGESAQQRPHRGRRTTPSF